MMRPTVASNNTYINNIIQQGSFESFLDFFGGVDKVEVLANNDPEFRQALRDRFGADGKGTPSQKDLKATIITQFMDERKQAMSFDKEISVKQEYYKRASPDANGFVDDLLKTPSDYAAVPIFGIDSAFCVLKKMLSDDTWWSWMMGGGKAGVKESDKQIKAWGEQVEKWITGGTTSTDYITAWGKGNLFSVATINARDNTLQWENQGNGFIEMTAPCAYLVILIEAAETRDPVPVIEVTRNKDVLVEYIHFADIDSEKSVTRLINNEGFEVAKTKVFRGAAAPVPPRYKIALYAEKRYHSLIAEDIRYGILHHRKTETLELIQYWAVFMKNAYYRTRALPHLWKLEEISLYVHYRILFEFGKLPPSQKEDIKVAVQNLGKSASDKKLSLLQPSTYTDVPAGYAVYTITVTHLFRHKSEGLLPLSAAAKGTLNAVIVDDLKKDITQKVTLDILIRAWVDKNLPTPLNFSNLKIGKKTAVPDKAIATKLEAVATRLLQTIPTSVEPMNNYKTRSMVLLTVFSNVRFYYKGFVCPLLSAIAAYNGVMTVQISTAKFIAYNTEKWILRNYNSLPRDSDIFEVYKQMFFLVCYIFQNGLAGTFVFKTTVLPLVSIK